MTLSFFRANILPLIGTDVSCSIDFLKSKGFIRRSMYCIHCYEPMQWTAYRKIKDNFVWKCVNKFCIKYKTTLSIRSGSIFENSRTDLQMIIFTIYLWSTNTSHKDIVEKTGICPQKVSAINRYLRNICVRYFEKYPIKLGGNGIICQIDESLFCHKQKYHRGRVSDNQIWVFGIVDTSFSPARGYMEVVEKRDKHTLFPIISKVCRPGSIIYSDQWSAYREVESLGFKHKTVNHSLNFVNPENGVHTQHIESYWCKQKLKIKQ